MPFTGFDQKKLLNSQAVKKKKKSQAVLPKKVTYPYCFIISQSVSQRKGGKKIQTLEVLIPKTAYVY